MNRNTQRWILDAAVWVAGAIMAGALAFDALAGERQTIDPARSWRRECGSCHVAYPPRLLDAAAWRTIMQTLDRHFGAEASLEAAAAAPILAFLEAGAGPDRGKRNSAGGTRITEARWFRHEHAEIAAAVWNRKAVGSRSNCGACHRDADRGTFREAAVRLPGQGGKQHERD